MKRVLRILVALCVLSVGSVSAQSKDTQYVVGAGDVLQLDVWQVPSLNQQLTVRADGMVVLPMAGEVRAAGLTIERLQQEIVNRLRDFNRDVSVVSLTVTEFKSRSIYVLGQVLKPGKYAYGEPINLFDLIREAGGFTDDALRTRVKVVHREGSEESVEYANVELALNAGTLESLPKVRAGDTVLISKRTGPAYGGSEGVQLIGQVKSPSIYPLEAAHDLVSVLLLAGGPTNEADLKKVRLVRRDGTRSIAHEINVTDYLEHGIVSANPTCEPGDTVFVPRRRQSWYRTLRTVSVLLGTVGSGFGLYYALRN